MGYQTWRQGPFLPQAMKCQKEVSRYFLIIEPKHIQICVSGEGVWLQPGGGLPRLAPVVQVLRLPGDQLWPRRRGDQQDDQQEVCSSFKTSLGYLLSYSGRSRYQRKRESHAPTQSSVPRWKLQYNPFLMYQGWALQNVGEEQLHDLLGIHIQHGKLWSQRDFKVPAADWSQWNNTWTGSWFSTGWSTASWQVLEALRRTSSSIELEQLCFENYIWK